MLTAANKTTRQAQEVLCTAQGGLMTAQEECRCHRLTETGTIQTGACRLAGVLLVSGMEAATVTVECDSDPVVKLRAASGWAQSVMLPMPLGCPADLAVTLTGNGAEAYLYVADAV